MFQQRMSDVSATLRFLANRMALVEVAVVALVGRLTTRRSPAPRPQRGSRVRPLFHGSRDPIRASRAILVGDQLGTTQYARGRTTCASMNVMRGCRKLADGSRPAKARYRYLLGVKWSQVQILSAQTLSARPMSARPTEMASACGDASVDGSGNSELATLLGAVQQAVQQPSAITTAPLGEPDA